MDQRGFFIINEEGPFQACSPIENYRSIPDVVELNSGTIFTGDVTAAEEENLNFNKHNAANAHLSNKYSLF